MNFNKALSLFLLVTVLSSTAASETSVWVPAVTESNGEGILAKLTVKTVPGSGKTFTDVGTRTGFTAQDSAKIARRYAEKYLEADLSEVDVLFSIDTNASQIDGPSAGAAMTTALIFDVQGWNLPDYVTMTGTISDSGFIGSVGGIFAKVKSASENDLKLAVIPAGQAQQSGSWNGSVVDVNLVEFAPSEWGIIVAEAATIDDAVKIIHAPLDFDAIQEIEITRVPTFNAEGLPLRPELKEFKDFSVIVTENTEVEIREAEEALATTKITDARTLDRITSLISSAKSLTSEAEEFMEKNYLYTGANNSFIALTNVRLAKVLLENPSILNEESRVFKQLLDEQVNRCSDLLADANRELRVESIDWVVGAQQRLLWACRNLALIQGQVSEEDLVERVGGTLSSVDNLQDLVYAESWMDSTEAMLGLSTERGAVISEARVQDVATNNLIEIEDLLTSKGCSLSDYESPSCSIEAKELFTRYYECAKTAFELQWFAASSYCSAVASGAIQASAFEDGVDNADTDLIELNELISEQVSKSQELSDESNTLFSPMFWQHAKYFSERGEFNALNGARSQAIQDYSTTVLLLQVSNNLSVTSNELFKTAGVDTGFNSSIEVVENVELSPIAIALILLIFFAALIVLLMITFESKKSVKHKRGKRRDLRHI